MIDYPIVDILVPDRNLLILLVLLWRNKILADNLLKFKLVCQLINGIKHIISFPVEVFLCCVEKVLGLVVLLPESLKFFRLKVELFLNAVKFVLGVQEIRLLLLQLFLQISLSLLLFLKLLLGFLEFFLLLLGNLDGLRTYDHLLLHLFKPVDKLLLFGLGLLLGIFPFSDFLDEFFLLLLFEIGLVLNVSSLLLRLVPNGFLFLLKLGLELCHFLLVFNLHNFFDNIGVAHDSSLPHHL